MSKQNKHDCLIAIQSSIQGLSKKANNPFYKSKYVTLSDILGEVKPILNDNDCYLTQNIEVKERDLVILETKICYKDGEVLLKSTAPLPIGSQDVNNPQKWGSAITYMRRYSLTALLGIQEEDDDGNKAVNNRSSQLNKLADCADQDMREVNRKANEEMYRGLKVDIERCGSVSEMKGLLSEKKSSFKKLQKYAPDLFDKLMDCKDSMKEILDPEGEES